MKDVYKLIIWVSVLMLFGCLPDTSGMDPPKDQLIFPVGLATTQNDDFLLVANSNFDLQYNAGTLVAIDLNKALGDVKGADAIVSNHYNCTNSQDGKYCEMAASDLILKDETINIGAFASDLKLTPAGDRALIPVRGERAILLVDVTEGSNVLDCGSSDNNSCDSAHKVQSNELTTLPIEPYEVTSMDVQVVREDDEKLLKTLTLGFATHLSGGEVSMFLVSEKQEGQEITKYDSKLLRVIPGVVAGASGIASNKDNNTIYVVGRNDPKPHVATMKVITDQETGSQSNYPWFGQTGSIPIYKEMHGGTNASSIAITDDGSNGFLVTRNPAALIKLNLDNYAMKDMVSVCAEPSVVQLHEDSQGTIYAFVLCFLTGQVFIVNTELMQTEVRTTGSGPQAIVFDKTRQLAYIANFRESTISIINAEPPFDHVMVQSSKNSEDKAILKIGEFNLPEGQE